LGFNINVIEEVIICGDIKLKLAISTSNCNFKVLDTTPTFHGRKSGQGGVVYSPWCKNNTKNQIGNQHE
jgi:hypothetical protein